MNIEEIGQNPNQIKGKYEKKNSQYAHSDIVHERFQKHLWLGGGFSILISGGNNTEVDMVDSAQMEKFEYEKSNQTYLGNSIYNYQRWSWLLQQS